MQETLQINTLTTTRLLVWKILAFYDRNDLQLWSKARFPCWKPFISVTFSNASSTSQQNRYLHSHFDSFIQIIIWGTYVQRLLLSKNLIQPDRANFITYIILQIRNCLSGLNFLKATMKWNVSQKNLLTHTFSLLLFSGNKSSKISLGHVKLWKIWHALEILLLINSHVFSQSERLLSSNQKCLSR
jgi:hypothetical protein